VINLKSKHLKRKIKVAKGTKNLGRVKNVEITWEAHLQALSKPVVTREKYKDYLGRTVSEQAILKNVGGYWIGGWCDDGIRSKKSIPEREVVTLDLDYATPELIDLIKEGLTGISHLEFAIHGTRKYSDETPRSRITILLEEAISADQYNAVSRILADMLDIETVDKVSYRLAQMMYYPSHSIDSEWFFYHNAGEAADAEAILEAFGDWKDFSKLPRAERDKNDRESAEKAEDPTSKKGIPGAVCRAYPIEDAIAEHLPHIYLPGDGHSDKPRYTFVFGSAANGAVVEDDGLFLYSHHGTDPCGDRLVNSFDLLRIHLFGHLDKGKEESGEDFNPTSLPSYKKMIEVFKDDPKVLAEYNPALVADDEFDDEDVDGVELSDDEESDEVDPEVEDLLGTPSTRFDDDVEDLLGGSSTGSKPKKAKKEKKTLTPLERMNKKHAVIRAGGKTVVGTFKPNADIEIGSMADLHTFYENQPMPGPTGQPIPASKWWNMQAGRRTYENGIGFWPNKGVKGAYNLWTGFSVKPDPTKSCELFFALVRDVITRGNKAGYDYIMGWCAHLIQRPQEKPGVALVFKGVKGAGKDTFANYLGALIKNHHVTIAQMAQLTGKFNAHQEKALLLHVQEGFWAGDPSAVGPLNHMITSETAMIERKGIDPIEIDSYMRVFISSNDKWVVPATEGERRYAVFHVSPHMARNREYFGAIKHEKENGGLEALMHFLLDYDLSNFDVGVPPETEGLAEQKVAGLKNADLFYYELLAAGEIINEEDFGDDRNWRTHPVRVHREGLYESYKEWWKERRGHGHRELLSIVDFGKELSRLCPSRTIRQMGSGAGRIWVHKLPDLTTCRQEFAAKIDPLIKWDDDLGQDDAQDLI
jgi:hypothetical protein